MASVIRTVDEHPRVIAATLGLVIVFFLTACVFHEAIPVCHFLFNCDHGLH